MSGAVRTIFFGSGSFGVPILEALAEDPRISLLAVVTAPDRPAGRDARPTSTPVGARAAELGLPLLQPVRLRSEEAITAIRELRADLGVLADYGQIVPPAVLEAPRLGILNVHPSTLPRHRGATPIQATIAAGDGEAGVSLIRMDAGVDTGPLVATRAWALDGTEHAPQLEAEAARRGVRLLRETLEGWLAGEIQPVPQAATVEPPTRRLRRDDARLDPSRSAIELERRIRANEPWPGAFLETSAGRVIVLNARVGPGRAGDAPGALVDDEGRLALATADGRLILERVQLAGRRPVGGLEFLRGRRGLAGTMAGRP